uniref:Uncharacterized protein n=1 Tax=Monodelphis domestica TaxID=13616 RepID=A0A5F8H4Y7_MONDO
MAGAPLPLSPRELANGCFLLGSPRSSPFSCGHWRNFVTSSWPCTTLTLLRSKMNWSRSCWSMDEMQPLLRLLKTRSFLGRTRRSMALLTGQLVEVQNWLCWEGSLSILFLAYTSLPDLDIKLASQPSMERDTVPMM